LALSVEEGIFLFFDGEYRPATIRMDPETGLSVFADGR
jgi:hypothetical protein